MKFNFVNLSDNILNGMKEFSIFHGFEIAQDGISVNVEIISNKNIVINRHCDKIYVKLPSEGYIFRAMTHILSNKESEYIYKEPVKFSTIGAMFDVSQGNSLFNIDTCKLMLKIMAGMGFNMFMLYLEDCYAIDGEPYFGYMRPKYTQAELKELDDYAYNLGIEMIPCIQTLGHLKDALKRYYPYSSYTEDETTLLVGDERTYKLIEKMIKAASKPFRSKRIHVGLDEAFFLGQGRYLMENGYRQKSEIMYEHLEKVYEITVKNGLRPMMWFDMFFRAKNKTNDLYDSNVYFSEEDKLDRFPGLQPIYWDYYHTDVDFYLKMIEKIRYLSNDIVFAGCSRNVRTFGAHHHKSQITTNPALSACKTAGITEVFTTVWGDDNRESSAFSILPDLCHFAEHGFTDGIPDDTVCSKRFKECTHENYADFIKISAVDEVIEYYKKPNEDNLSLSKVIMWQDIMLGMADFDLGDFNFEPHYKSLTQYFSECKIKSKNFEKLFDFYEKLSCALEIKSGIGRNLYKAYNENDNNFLNDAVNTVLPELKKRLETLHNAHRELFMMHHKSIGWEILDIRYGGSIQRCNTAICRIKKYLNGEITRIEEFEEQRLSFDNTNMIPESISYGRICSASRVSEKV